MDTVDSALVSTEIDGAVARVTLDRPRKKNAMNPQLHTQMLAALTALERDENVKVLVLSGVGDSFCAGMDLEECFHDPFEDPQRFVSENRVAQTWFRKLKDFPAPTIARVNGWCFGGGVELVGLCDMAVAADDVTFGLSEINFGTFPGGGTTWAVAHNLPRKHAMRYILTGEVFSAEEAARIGLINFAVPREQLDDSVGRIVGKLVDKNRAVLVAAKEVYEGALLRNFSDGIDWEMAKLHELSYLSRDDWIKRGLTQFKARTYRPGLQAYKLDA
jgi:trans-feruloyl-CoA hydratase/vanillin synthase